MKDCLSNATNANREVAAASRIKKEDSSHTISDGKDNPRPRPAVKKGWKGYVLGEVETKHLLSTLTTNKRERKQKKSD